MTTPGATASIVDEIVKKVQTETGIEPAELRVQRNLGTFLIHAKPAFPRRLILEPDVHHAAAID